jgi:hypothetical protein
VSFVRRGLPPFAGRPNKAANTLVDELSRKGVPGPKCIPEHAQLRLSLNGDRLKATSALRNDHGCMRIDAGRNNVGNASANLLDRCAVSTGCHHRAQLGHCNDISPCVAVALPPSVGPKVASNLPTTRELAHDRARRKAGADSVSGMATFAGQRPWRPLHPGSQRRRRPLQKSPSPRPALTRGS